MCSEWSAGCGVVCPHLGNCSAIRTKTLNVNRSRPIRLSHGSQPENSKIVEVENKSEVAQSWGWEGESTAVERQHPEDTAMAGQAGHCGLRA